MMGRTAIAQVFTGINCFPYDGEDCHYTGINCFPYDGEDCHYTGVNCFPYDGEGRHYTCINCFPYDGEDFHYTGINCFPYVLLLGQFTIFPLICPVIGIGNCPKFPSVPTIYSWWLNLAIMYIACYIVI